MTHKQLLECVRVFGRRRPFREYCIEFVNEQRIIIKHPDAVVWTGDLWYFRSPQRANVLFTADSVCRLLDDSPVSAPPP
jgi:hypothetical protein